MWVRGDREREKERSGGKENLSPSLFLPRRAGGKRGLSEVKVEASELFPLSILFSSSILSSSRRRSLSSLFSGLPPRAPTAECCLLSWCQETFRPSDPTKLSVQENQYDWYVTAECHDERDRFSHNLTWRGERGRPQVKRETTIVIHVSHVHGVASLVLFGARYWIYNSRGPF